MSLNIVVHAPCSYPLNINEYRVCGALPQQFKRELINATNSIPIVDSFLADGDFLTAKNVFVLVIPVVEILNQSSLGMLNALASPILVTIYVGSGKSKNIAYLGKAFNKVVADALRSSFGNHEFSVHMVYADISYTIP